MELQKQMDMLTVIEETEFDNRNMFSDEETAKVSTFDPKADFNSVLYSTSGLTYNTRPFPAETSELEQRHISIQALEESTYNSFLNLFDHSRPTGSPPKQSLYQGSTAAFTLASPKEKHFSASTVSTVSGSTAMSTRSDSTAMTRYSVLSESLEKPVKKSDDEDYEADRIRRSLINLEFYDLTSEDYNGVPFNFSLLFDKVVMIVNVASFCRFTRQYKDLEALYEKYNSKGFEIIAFPSNQFLQEPKSENEIVQYCSMKFNVSFPIMKKIRVNGKHTSPIYEYLKSQKKGALHSKRVFWNFEKFLVDKRGNVVHRGTSLAKPKTMEEIIVKLLDE